MICHECTNLIFNLAFMAFCNYPQLPTKLFKTKPPFLQLYLYKFAIRDKIDLK